MRARSTTTDSPPIFLPSASASRASVSWKSGDSNSSRSITISRRSFGSSMPMALRPGTTATRAAIALIERAMSSASPMTREDLVPGRGLELVKRDHGAGAHIGDLALDAEIGKHAFELARILLQHLVADAAAFVGARLRLQQLELRRFVGRIVARCRRRPVCDFFCFGASVVMRYSGSPSSSSSSSSSRPQRPRRHRRRRGAGRCRRRARYGRRHQARPRPPREVPRPRRLLELGLLARACAVNQPKPRLTRALVCMAICMAAPSEAFAHSLGMLRPWRPQAR